MKKILLTLLLFVTLLTISGCDLFAPEEKEFSGSGITITLNEDFVVTQTVIVPFYLVSLDNIFMGSRESKDIFDGTYVTSLEDYAQAVLDMNNHSESTIHSSDKEYVYAYYEATVEDIEYGYMLICMESDDYYYVMNLGCLNSDLEDNKEQYIEWANTIVVE